MLCAREAGSPVNPGNIKKARVLFHVFTGDQPRLHIHYLYTQVGYFLLIFNFMIKNVSYLSFIISLSQFGVPTQFLDKWDTDKWIKLKYLGQDKINPG